MNEPQHDTTTMTRFGSRGLVIITKVPTSFFDSSANLEVTGSLSLRPHALSKSKNVEVKLLLPYDQSMAASVSQRELKSDDDDKGLNFCSCDTSKICTNVTAITLSDPVIRICMAATPSNAVLTISYSAVLYSKDLPPPDLTFEYDDSNENKAIAFAELSPEYFEESQLGLLSVYVKGDINAPGFLKGEAAFTLDFELRAESNTLAPTKLPTLGAMACVCDKQTSTCIGEGRYISFGFVDVHICVL